MAAIIDLAADAGRPPAPHEARAQLESLLADPAFKASPRRRDFLRFVVEETLAGRTAGLKGFTVALAVFGRDETFDQQADPVVRIEARRLRRDLDSYYVGAGREAPIRIAIPTGGYEPHFERQNPAAAGVLALRAPASADGIAMTVLPFEVAGRGEDAGFLAAGLPQQLVTDLMRMPGLRLYAAPAPSFASPGEAVALGQRLGVGYVVTGTIASDASILRIGAQLLDVGSGRVLWSEVYDREAPPGALLDTQAELASAIAAATGGAARTARESAS